MWSGQLLENPEPGYAGRRKLFQLRPLQVPYLLSGLHPSRWPSFFSFFPSELRHSLPQVRISGSADHLVKSHRGPSQSKTVKILREIQF